jgi:hypothetical protein
MHASDAIRNGQARRVGITRPDRQAGLARKASIVLVAAFVEAILVGGLLAATLGIALEGPSSGTVQTPAPAPPPALNGR